MTAGRRSPSGPATTSPDSAQGDTPDAGPAPESWALRAAMVAGGAAGPVLYVRYGARVLLGIPASLDALVARVRRIPLVPLLEMLGRLEAILANAKGEEVQGRLLAGLFPPGRLAAMMANLQADLRREAAEDRAAGRATHWTPPAFFDRQQLGALAVLAASVHAPLTPDPVTGQDAAGARSETEAAGNASGVTTSRAEMGATEAPHPEVLGEALLILGDLLGEPLDPVGYDVETPEGRRRWAYYFAVAGFQHGSDPSVHAVARAADLYLNSHDDLRDDPEYVDLRALFTEATGLTAGGYMFVTLTLVGRMLDVTATTAHERTTVIPPEVMGPPWFTPAQRRRFLQVAGQPLAEFCAAARAALPPGTFRPYFLLPLEQSPVVRVGDPDDPGGGPALCISPSRLEERMTRGLYHVLLNARPGPEHARFRLRYQHFVGRVFEDYVDRAVRRMAAALTTRPGRRPRHLRTSGAVRYVGEAEMQAAVDAALPQRHARPAGDPSRRVCDAALLVGRDLLLFESKAKHFSLAARSGDDADAFFAKLDEIVVDAAQQLAATVEHLFAGRLAAAGLSPAGVRRVFPVGVSLDVLPMSHDLRAWIEERVWTTGLHATQARGGVQIFGFEPCDVGDLEWLELALERTRAQPGGVLATKQASPYARGMSLASWGQRTGFGGAALGAARLAYHTAYWERLGDAARSFLDGAVSGDAPGAM